MKKRITFTCSMCRRRVTAPLYLTREGLFDLDDAACWECSDTNPLEAREDARAS